MVRDMNTTNKTKTETAAKIFITFRLDGCDYECSEIVSDAAPVAYCADGGADGHNGAYWQAVESVACSHCVASGSQFCTAPDGEPAKGYHAARIARARKLGRVAG